MKKILPFLVALLLISGCTKTNKKPRHSSSFDEGSSQIISSIDSVTSNIEPTSQSGTSAGTSHTSIAPTSAGTSHTSVAPTSAGSSTTSRPSSSSTSSKPTSSSTPAGDEYIRFNDYPSISLRKFLAPTNEPIELITHLSEHHWWENDLKEDMPSADWTFIYGNKNSRGDFGDDKVKPSFYSVDQGKPGGLMMDQKWKGIQTPLFHHTGAKLEINMVISQVNNNTHKPEDSLPIGFFLFYDKDANYLENLTHEVSRGQITANTTQVHFYCTGSGTENVAYFEFRLVALPSKNSQAYNFGIGELNVNSWERA